MRALCRGTGWPWGPEQATLPRVEDVPNPMQPARQTRGGHHVCFLCEWVDARLRPNGRFSVGCTNPKCRVGQAGWGMDCCSFSRDPGCDDDPEAIDRLLAAQPPRM